MTDKHIGLSLKKTEEIKDGKYDIPLDIGVVSLRITGGKVNGRVIVKHKKGFKDVAIYKNGVMDGDYARFNKKGKIIKRAKFSQGVEDLV